MPLSLPNLLTWLRVLAIPVLTALYLPGVLPAAPLRDALATALGRLSAAGIRVTDVALRKPTLDDVFLALTGHEADEKIEEAVG